MALGTQMGFPGVSEWIDPRRRTILGFAAGLAGGQTPQQGIAMGLQGAAQGREADDAWATTQKAEQERQAQLNQTVQFLQEKHPDLAAMVESGMPVGEAWGTALERMKPGYGDPNSGPDAPSSVREWEYFNALPPDQQGAYLRMKRANPYLDIGTGYVQPDPISPGSTAGPAIVKENQQEAFDTAFGGEMGRETAGNIAAAPQEIANAEKTIALVDKMIGNEEMGIPMHPGLDETFGTVGFIPQQMTPAWPGTPKADFQALREQMSGKLFLEAYATLKGGGQITEVEGLKAEQAMARMQVAQSKEAFIEAMQEFRDAVASGMAKLQAHSQGGGQAAPAPAGGGSRTTSTGVTYTVGQ